jgi:hypothetical protein
VIFRRTGTGDEKSVLPNPALRDQQAGQVPNHVPNLVAHFIEFERGVRQGSGRFASAVQRLNSPPAVSRRPLAGSESELILVLLAFFSLFLPSVSGSVSESVSTISFPYSDSLSWTVYPRCLSMAFQCLTKMVCPADLVNCRTAGVKLFMSKSPFIHFDSGTDSDPDTGCYGQQRRCVPPLEFPPGKIGERGGNQMEPFSHIFSRLQILSKTQTDPKAGSVQTENFFSQCGLPPVPQTAWRQAEAALESVRKMIDIPETGARRNRFQRQIRGQNQFPGPLNPHALHFVHGGTAS